MEKHFPVRGKALDNKPLLLKAVDGVNLAIAKGETLGLVGESGCGKSTLARMVVRLLKPTAGKIFLEGHPIWNGDYAFNRDFPRRVQMVFQDPFSSLNPRRTVGKTIGEGLAVHHVGNHAQRKERVTELLQWVGLQPEHAQRYPHEFSGGQRQRVAVARALALDPELLVCDEPVSALDVSIQAQVLNLLQELQDRLGLTYLFISHDLSVVSHVSDRVAVMYLGKIVELSPSRELYERPLHPYTQALMLAAPTPDPARAKALASDDAVLKGDPPSPIAPPKGCHFHPRCPRAMDICAQTEPRLKETEPGRTVSCHLYS